MFGLTIYPVSDFIGLAEDAIFGEIVYRPPGTGYRPCKIKQFVQLPRADHPLWVLFKPVTDDLVLLTCCFLKILLLLFGEMTCPVGRRVVIV